jgi:hypothetical protein
VKWNHVRLTIALMWLIAQAKQTLIIRIIQT